MTYSLSMPRALKDQGWRVKIRNLDRSEEPHVTIMRKTMSWRYRIRNPGFMDRAPDPNLVPGEVIHHITAHLEELRREWDLRYPENPVASEEDE
jgi:hypothetical protein